MQKLGARNVILRLYFMFFIKLRFIFQGGKKDG
jgi:hypothetical protein